MTKSKNYILALTAALIMPLSSCKETIIYVTPDEIIDEGAKTPIELSVGGVDGAVESSGTRAAVITDDETKTYNLFNQDTKIFMVMKSTYGTEDYLGSHKDKYTVSRGEVKANTNTITFDALNQKYWDDAHARSSQLDIWAYASMVPSTWNTCSFQVPNPNWTALSTETLEHKMLEYIKKDYETNTQAADKSPYPWTEHTIGTDKGSMGAIYPCIMEWKVTNTPWAQTANSIQYQDLMFSNNLANNTERGGSDKRLKFNNQQTKKFDTGEMKFYHAMSKLTINIIEGDGFDKTSQSDFQFATGKNINLNGFNTQGTFNIKNGYFEKVENTRNEITSIALSAPKGADPNPYYTLQALAIPNIDGINGITDAYSRFVSDGTNTMMEFTIDDNTFKISSGALYKALHGKSGATEKTNNGTYIPLEAGKNYIFTFKVSKTEVKVTASVAEWEEVTAETVEPKINVTAEVGIKGAASTALTAFNFYMKEDAATNYAQYGGATNSSGADKTTAWTFKDSGNNPTHIYWPTHDTHYHMRGVAPTTTTVTSDKIAVENKAYDASTSLMVGAPEIAEADKLCHSTKHTQVDMTQRGICAREANINLNFRYMMSQVEVRLSTTNGNDQVKLTNAKVEIVNGYTKGNVDLHSRTIESQNTVADFTLAHVASEDNNYRHSEIVPQSLTNNNKNLQFKITIINKAAVLYVEDDEIPEGKSIGDVKTPADIDIYYADIKDISITENDIQKNITEWEACKHYIYTLNLRKTEIKCSATITDWVEVKGTTNVWF